MNKSKDELTEILGDLATDVINYDKRMTEAGAPPIRFVSKYVSKAKAKLLARERRIKLEAKIEALDLAEDIITRISDGTLGFVTACDVVPEARAKLQSQLDELKKG